jgi:cytoskeletal protein CcmA (bactofilin family)
MASIFGKKKVDDDGGSTDKPLVDSKGPQKMAEPSKVETIIGPGATIKGEIHSRGTVRVDGNVEGKVNADGSVIVGEKGAVNAEVTAGLVVIGGTVHGKVNGREKVEILSTGRLHGDVSTKPSKFVVAEGVIFEGRCSMGQAEEPKQTPPKTKPPDAEKQEVGAANKP